MSGTGNDLPTGDIPLAQFCELRSQKEAALILGCTPGAVSQIIAAARKVFITRNVSGEFDHYEITKIRPKKAA